VGSTMMQLVELIIRCFILRRHCYDIEKNINEEEEEAESIVEDAERFLLRIKEAINGVQKKFD
jgi:uncharacterized protein (UPF0332 family)